MYPTFLCGLVSPQLDDRSHSVNRCAADHDGPDSVTLVFSAALRCGVRTRLRTTMILMISEALMSISCLELRNIRIEL